MKYLKLFIEHSVYKNYTSDEHVENIEDILAEYTDDREFLLKVSPHLGSNSWMTPIGVRSKKLKKLKRPNKLNRTFSVTLYVDESIVMKMVTPEEREYYYDTYNYRNGDLNFFRSQILNKLTELKNEAIERLERFGYFYYKDSSGKYCNFVSFLVTYKSRKI